MGNLHVADAALTQKQTVHDWRGCKSIPGFKLGEASREPQEEPDLYCIGSTYESASPGGLASQPLPSTNHQEILPRLVPNSNSAIKAWKLSGYRRRPKQSIHHAFLFYGMSLLGAVECDRGPSRLR